MDLRDALGKIASTQAFSAAPLTDVNQKNVVGDMPLHVAASLGDIDVMRVLLDNGADVNGRGEHGLTPLHVAAEEYHAEAVRLLLERGALPIRSVWGDLPRAHCRNKAEIHDLLIRRGF